MNNLSHLGAPQLTTTKMEDPFTAHYSQLRSAAESTDILSIPDKILNIVDDDSKDYRDFIAASKSRIWNTAADDGLSDYPTNSWERRLLLREEYLSDRLQSLKPHTYYALEARARIDTHIVPTPLISADRLIDADCRLFLKPEHLQLQRSFKLRGALHAAMATSSTRHEGLLTASAGNHGLGLAQAALFMEMPAKVVVAENASAKKIEKIKNLGAQVIRYGASYDEAAAYCMQVAKQDPSLLYVHPFDDESVTRGNSTQAVEVWSERQDVDYAFYPVGGGGNISANAAVMSELTSGKVQNIGVVLSGSDAMKHSFEQHRLVRKDCTSNFSDGTAVARGSQRALNLMQRYVQNVIAVDEQQVAQAMIDLSRYTGHPVEAAGALALAGARSMASRLKGNVCVYVSGGNVTNDAFRNAQNIAGC